MALIGSIVNQDSLQGQINDANGYLTGVITNAGLLGGQVVAERGLKGEKGDTGDTGAAGHSPVVTASKAGKSTTVYVDGSSIATILDGNDGQNGNDGADGFSPIATVSKVGNTATITVTDNNGTTTATVSDGADGKDGSDGKDGKDGTDGNDGYSPIANVSKVGDTATITITDSNGTTTASVTDGADGQNGADGKDGKDGYSPSASVNKAGDTATITITDENGTTTASVTDGSDGKDGSDGADGKDGKDGADGHSPVVTASKAGKTTTVYVDGSSVATILDGNDGTNGTDGYSPSASVNKAGDTATITITDENGTTTASVSDGTNGTDGYSPVANVVKAGDTATITITDENGTTTASISDGTDGVLDVEVNGTSVVSDHVASVTVPTQTSQLTNNSLFARGHVAAFHGTCSTAAATAEKAVTCADFKAADLVAGVMILVEFDNTNSAAVADLKLNVNSTGAYAIKQNASGTMSNLGDKGYLKTTVTYPFIFNGTYWVTWYDTNTNTIGYTVRTNGLQIPVKTACYRYRICFTSPDGLNYIPANASTSTSATASKTVTTEKIDPFGRIIYYSYTTAVAANGNLGTAYQMEQYNGVTLGYSFNRTDAALTMTTGKPVYVKCAPQTDGSAIIDATTPFVQDLPTTEDGKIYIFLGVATSATAIEFTLQHPVYYFKKGCVRQYTNAYIPTSASDIGAQETLVSGTNIKTINSTSLLGSGDISITEGLAPLIGTTSGTTPSAVKIALREGRMVCLQATGTLSGVALDLRFTTWNGATDTTYGGYAIDIVASQTIAYYSGTYYLFELVGTVGLDWEVLSTTLAEKSDIPSNVSDLTNDSGYLTLGDLPIYNGGVS